MKIIKHLAVLVCAAATFASAQELPKPSRLLLTSPPQLVDCAPVMQSPCMSAAVTPGDSAGKPAPFVLPQASQLTDAFTLQSASGDMKPFYVSAGLGPDAGQHTNVVLMLVDISGSMNQPMAGSRSRFEALKSAIAQFLAGMQDGSDRVAIVPFESHDVVSTIRSAVFTTHRVEALAQLNALRSPGPKNNTALYQAVFSGVDSLKGELASLQHDGVTAAELQPHLIVMTDGKNEVEPGDDPGLLNGDHGLQQAVEQVQVSHLDTIGIGFGDQKDIDADALKSLTKRFYYAADAAQLLAALHVSRSAVSHSIQLTWPLPEANRVALMGHDQVWTPRLQLEDGSVLLGDPLRLIVPATNAPVYDRGASPEELQALIATHPPATSGWSSVLVHLLLYLGAAVILLILWFWVPRLIWGEQYSSSVPGRSRRWSSDRSGVTSASGVQVRSTSSLPAGFTPELESASPLRRSAAQTTQVQPRSEASRTRLTFDQNSLK
ncbi:VWA domain-containing protein [Granulicella sp. S156]|uniref:vWA domain-containing protein n=1 Tax=Granulicella sp. S156 TaxID=1747224 RepID=UPI00131B0115|nr:vWA domain-containing protein [Granulicella sp. S156]